MVTKQWKRMFKVQVVSMGTNVSKPERHDGRPLSFDLPLDVSKVWCGGVWCGVVWCGEVGWGWVVCGVGGWVAGWLGGCKGVWVDWLQP